MKYPFSQHHLFQSLKRFENQSLPIDFFLSQYFRDHKALGPDERRHISESIYGMCRHRSLLDYFVGENPSWEKRYQIFQTLEPERYYENSTIPLSTRLSVPEELLSVLEEDYGQKEAISLCKILQTQAPVTVRVNPTKISREELCSRWQEHDPLMTVHSPLGIRLPRRLPLFAMPEFKEGLFEVQDEASQISASFIRVEPGEHVLDYCAGSGGKTLAFAHRMNNKGQIYLHDIRPSVLDQARKRLKRAGIQNAQFLDAGHPQMKRLKNKVDWVLVDVPCTGTGTFRRNPDQKWKFTRSLLAQLIEEQKKIFESALSYVKKGGHIVYATCSLLKAENENQAEYFIKTYGLEYSGDPFSALPKEGEMDGFFTVALKKNY